MLALEQARGMIESTRADIAKRQGQLAQANNALQLLLGSYQHLPDDSASSAVDLQGVTLPPSLSSAILLQRPDILEAEHSLQAANANIGAARAAFFPSITLTSSLSGSSSELSSLFNAGGAMWNFIPKIELPIFNAGRNQASLDLAEIRQQQQVVNYEQKSSPPLKRWPTRWPCARARRSNCRAGALSRLAEYHPAARHCALSPRCGQLYRSPERPARYFHHPTNPAGTQLFPSGK